MKQLLTILLLLPLLSMAQNKAPKADAGPDTVLHYPFTTFIREGKGTDADGTIVSYKWDFYSSSFAPQNQQALRLETDSVVYVYRLTVTDNKNAKGYDYVNVTYKFNPWKTLKNIPIGDIGHLQISNNGEYMFWNDVKGFTPKEWVIDVSKAVNYGGFGYFIDYDFGIPGDGLPGNVSKLRLFENGIELKPAHSLHADISALGAGRFSHWGNALLFSAIDNSNPVTNGKLYTYRIE